MAMMLINILILLMGRALPLRKVSTSMSLLVLHGVDRRCCKVLDVRSLRMEGLSVRRRLPTGMESLGRQTRRWRWFNDQSAIRLVNLHSRRCGLHHARMEHRLTHRRAHRHRESWGMKIWVKVWASAVALRFSTTHHWHKQSLGSSLVVARTRWTPAGQDAGKETAGTAAGDSAALAGIDESCSGWFVAALGSLAAAESPEPPGQVFDAAATALPVEIWKGMKNFNKKAEKLLKILTCWLARTASPVDSNPTSKVRPATARLPWSSRWMSTRRFCSDSCRRSFD